MTETLADNDLLVLGIEGVSCSGKTTLIGNLRRSFPSIRSVPCFYDVSSPELTLPPIRSLSARGALKSLRRMLELEHRRFEILRDFVDHGVHTVLLDRTISTSLAHISAVSPWWYDIQHEARALVENDPSVCTAETTYLVQTDWAERRIRGRNRPGLPAIYYSQPYEKRFSEHMFSTTVQKANAGPAARVGEQISTRLRERGEKS